jgi:HEAT repeat protein
MVRDGDWSAAEALGSMGAAANDAVPALVEALREAPEGRLGGWVAESVAKIGPSALPVLCDALDTLGPRKQELIVEAIGQMGPPAKDAALHIANLLTRGDGRLRARAAWALARIDPERTTECVELLLKSVGDADARTRRLAHQALGALGPATPEVVPALIQALRDPDCDVRCAAAGSLGEIGPPAREALPALLRTVRRRGEFAHVTARSADALAEMLRPTQAAAP